MTRHLQRRRFLQASVAIATPTIVSPRVFGDPQRPAPSDRISIGVVGLGSRGFNLIDGLLRAASARIVAVCDVDKLHYRDRDWGVGPAFGRTPAQRKIDTHYGAQRGVAVTSDFRELCARDDIDAIVVATPDHWHALCTLEALRNGKDVYCEKPVTHTFREGQQVYRAVAKQKAVFQTGSQQRSDGKFRRAVELVRNGHLGKIQSVQVGLPPGYDMPQGDDTVTAPPRDLNYDMWCGPAPKLPYMRARHHRWWRGHRAFGGGVLMDWIGHHNDIAHWALGMDNAGPTTIEARGWTYPAGTPYNTPHHYEIHSTYPGDVTISVSSQHPIGARFTGADGWVFVRRGRMEASQPEWLENDFDVGKQRVYASNDHIGNFLECIKSRKPCIAPAETAHRSITPGHLAFVSSFLDRPLHWDAKREVVINDVPANELIQRNPYRAPWKEIG